MISLCLQRRLARYPPQERETQERGPKDNPSRVLSPWSLSLLWAYLSLGGLFHSLWGLFLLGLCLLGKAKGGAECESQDPVPRIVPGMVTCHTVDYGASIKSQRASLDQL